MVRLPLDVQIERTEGKIDRVAEHIEGLTSVVSSMRQYVMRDGKRVALSPEQVDSRIAEVGVVFRSEQELKAKKRRLLNQLD